MSASLVGSEMCIRDRDILGGRTCILLEQGPSPMIAEPSQFELSDGIKGLDKPRSGHSHVFALVASKRARGILGAPRNPEVPTQQRKLSDPRRQGRDGSRVH
eukprot:11667441-Alexandrium_andersonii.AAC.1